ncbi:MAG: hypothetical protein ABSG04_03220 [Verrucomicrobiota bacterium]
MKFRKKSFVFTLASLCAASALATTYTWTGNAPAPNNHLWSQTNNWSPPTGVPGPGDTAIIGTSSQAIFTVNLAATATVDNLTVLSSTLEGAGSLTVNTAMECLNAALAVGGGITVEGTFTVDPVPNIPVYNTTTLSCPMTLNGPSTIASNGVLAFGAAVTLTNNGPFQLDGGSQLNLYGYTGAAFINNHSFDVYDGQAIVTTGSAVFSNAPSGTVAVGTGATLELQGTLADSGTFFANTNAAIIVTAWTAFHDQAVFYGAGTTQLAGGRDTLDGTVIVDGNLLMGSNSLPDLTLNGTLEVDENGNFEWFGGGLTGVDTNVTGTILIDTNGVMKINNLNGVTLQNVVVTNNGFINWVDSGVLFMGYNAQIINAGFFIAFGDGELAPLAGGSPGYGVASFQNTFGTFEKQLGATNAATTIGIPFYDVYDGGVRVYNGNLWFSAGGTIGTWEVGSDAAVQLNGAKGGDYGLQDLGGAIKGLSGYGVGSVTINSGVTLALSALGSLEVDGGELIQNGGTLNGYDDYLLVENGGLFVWNGGSISNLALSIDSNSVMNLSGGAIKSLLATTISNAGTVNWTNANSVGSISAGDGVVFNNAGQFNIGCISYFNDVSTNINTRPVLTNQVTGVITEAGTSGTSVLGITLINLGKIIARQGNLELGPFHDYHGGYIGILADIDLDGGGITFDDPTVIYEDVEGSGTITAHGGLTFSDDEVDIYAIIFYGDITNDGSFVLFYGAPGVATFQGNNFNQTANGRLVIPVRGTNAATKDFGQIILQGYGQATLAGTLVADITNGYAPPVGATFPFISTFQRNGAFNHAILPQGMQLNYSPSGATLVVTGAVPVQILSPAVTNGQFAFGFNTITNRSYTVQYNDNLATGSWTFLTNFIGNGSFWQPTGLSPLVAQRFFRVTNP